MEQNKMRNQVFIFKKISTLFLTFVPKHAPNYWHLKVSCRSYMARTGIRIMNSSNSNCNWFHYHQHFFFWTTFLNFRGQNTIFMWQNEITSMLPHKDWPLKSKPGQQKKQKHSYSKKEMLGTVKSVALVRTW